MGEADVLVEESGAVVVHLPAAELFMIDLDEANSKVAHRDVGWLASPDPDLEGAARRAAEAALRTEALRLDILPKAQENAEKVVRSLLEASGVPEVRFETKAPRTEG